MFDSDNIQMNQLRKIDSERISDKVFELFITGEDFLYAFESRDGQVIFTNKRIVIIATKLYTGESVNEIMYYTLAYSQIANFDITTFKIPHFDHICCWILIHTKDKASAFFSFIENWDIFLIGKKISEFVLK